MFFDGAAFEVGMVPVVAAVIPPRIRAIVSPAQLFTGMQEIRMPLTRELPKAAFIIATRTTAEDGSFVAGRGQAWNLTAGAGMHAGIGMSSEDALALTNANRVGQDIAPVFIAGAAGTTVGLAGFVTWVAGGMRVLWLIAPPSDFRITWIFVFGDDVLAAAGTVAPGATTDPDVAVTTPAFKPDLLLAVNALTPFDETFAAGLSGQLGIAVRNSDDSATEYGLFMDSADNVATSNVRSLQFQGGVAHGLATDTTTIRKTHVVSFDAAGFTIRSVAGSAAGTSAGPTLGYLALKLGDRKVDLRPFSSGVATGLVTFSGLPFKPQALLVVALAAGSTSWADGTIDLIGGGGGNGIGFGNDDPFQAWNAQRERDAIGTSEAKSQLHATRLLHMANHAGAARLLAELSSFGSGTFVLNILTLTSGPHALLALSIEEEVTTVYLGSLVASAPMPTFSGTGELEFRGTLAAAAPMPTFSGTGTLEFPGALAALAPMPTFSGTGLLVFAGSLAAAAPMPSFAGTGLQVFQGAVAAVAPMPTFSGTGVVAFSGALGAAAPMPTFQGTGLLVFVGSLAVAAPMPTFEGTGTAPVGDIAGTLAASAPTPAFAGAGLLVFVGELAAFAPMPSFSGAGVIGPIQSFTLLLGSYTPASMLLGTYEDSADLEGTYTDSANMQGSYTDVAELQGSYQTATEMEGSL